MLTHLGGIEELTQTLIRTLSLCAFAQEGIISYTNSGMYIHVRLAGQGIRNNHRLARFVLDGKGKVGKEI